MYFVHDEHEGVVMAKHKVEISGIDTTVLKVLSNEEMKELFLTYQNGDLKAKEEIASGNLKLVLSILRRFNHKTDNLDDLFQIGCIGLMKAIEHFDLSHNVKFSTYAVPMIIGEIRRYLRDNSSLRVARSMKDIAYKSIKIREESLIQNGQEPTTEELARILNVEEIDIIVALDALKSPVSMSEPIYNDGGDVIYLSDQLEDKQTLSKNWDIKILLNEALHLLKEKERQIIIERFLIGKTQMEIADEIGISQAQVSRIEKNAVENVKKHFR